MKEQYNWKNEFKDGNVELIRDTYYEPLKVQKDEKSLIDKIKDFFKKFKKDK